MAEIYHLLSNRGVVFIIGIVIGAAIFYPQYTEVRSQLTVTTSVLRDRDETIRQMQNQFREDANAREKALVSQRDTYLEMIRAELMRLTAFKPQPEVRNYRREER